MSDFGNAAEEDEEEEEEEEEANDGLVKCTVIKQKGRKLGLNFNETDRGLLVKSVNPAGLVADQDCVVAGMKLMTIDDTDVSTMSKADATTVVKAAGQTIVFRFMRAKNIGSAPEMFTDPAPAPTAMLPPHLDVHETLMKAFMSLNG